MNERFEENLKTISKNEFWKYVKDSREERQLDIFKRNCCELGEENITQIENQSNGEPDGFIIKNDKKISVEITDLYKDEKKKEQESMASFITHLAKVKYEELLKPPLLVLINFASNHFGDAKYSLVASDKKKLSTFLVNKVIEFTNCNIKNSKRIYYYDDEGSDFLTNKIESIQIEYYPNNYKNSWSCNNSFCVEALSLDTVKKAISKKSERLDKYKCQYDLSWLILSTEWGFGSNWFIINDFSNIFLEQFSTNFDRIFLMECFSQKVRELKVLKKSVNKEINVQVSDTTMLN